MWVSSSDFTQDLKLGINILKQLEDVYRKLRNTLRYMLGALYEYDDQNEVVDYNALPDLEKWVLHKLAETEKELDECIEQYDINKYFSILYMFCANDLSSFFFDIRKDCLYCDHKDDHKRKAYRMVLYTIFQHIVRRLAPIMVFTAEEAWLSLQINKESSVHIQTFIAAEKEWFNSDIFEKINKVKEVRRSITTAIEIARKDKKLGSSLQASIDLYDPDNILSVKDEALWEEIAITSGFKIHNKKIPDEAFISDDLKNIGVVVNIANGEKCERCWKIFSSLKGKLCERCQSVLARNA
jgi:isoleucyl-tRNA synthetase